MTPFCLQAESSHYRKKRDEEASQSNQSQDVASAPKVPSAGLDSFMSNRPLPIGIVQSMLLVHRFYGFSESPLNE